MNSQKNVFDSNSKNSRRKPLQEASYERIVVGLRLRPTTQQERICSVAGDKAVIVKKSNERFQFDNVFDETSTSSHIFTQIVQPIVAKFVQGFNGSVCAYGQTSSGKTYTMKGSNLEPGLIQLSVDYIFQAIKSFDNHSSLKVSYIEIYNENIYDLLVRDELKPLQQFNDYRWETIVDMASFEQIFKFGEEQRHFGETKMNDNSSRSHVILQVMLETRSKSPPFQKKQSQLHLVDLAGSEALSKTQAEGLRRKEGFLINRSLLSLQSVVMRLKENGGKGDQFINFRDSKLTKILKQSLSGNSITAFLLTISQNVENYQESIHTMKFGIAAGALKNLVSANEISEGTCAQMEILQQQVDSLKFEVQQYTNDVTSLQEQLEAKEVLAEERRLEVEQLGRMLELKERELRDARESEQQARQQNEEYRELMKNLGREMRELKAESGESFRLCQQYEKLIQEKGLLKTKLMVEAIVQTEDDVFKMLSMENAFLKDQCQQIQVKCQLECSELREVIQQLQRGKECTPLKQKPAQKEGEQSALLQRSLRKNNEYIETLIHFSNLQTLHMEQTKQNMMLRNELDKKEQEYFELEQANCQLHKVIFELQNQVCNLEAHETEDFWKENKDSLNQGVSKENEQNWQREVSKKEKRRALYSPNKDFLKKKLQIYQARMHTYEQDLAKQQKSLGYIHKKKQELEQFSHHLYQACVENNIKII